jgi:hypothetical protein
MALSVNRFSSHIALFYMLYFSYDKPSSHNTQEYISMVKKINKFEDWISANKAAQLLSDKMGYRVEARYIRQKAKSKRQPVRTQSLGYHQLYHRDDILASTVKQKHPTP